MNKYIKYVKLYFGITTKEAKNYIKTTNENTLKNIKKHFENNAKKAFYED